MKAFTNEDKKKMEEMIRKDKPGWSKLPALLHRLECAEAYILGQNVTCQDCDNTLVSTDEDNRLYTKWLASKGGKEGGNAT